MILQILLQRLPILTIFRFAFEAIFLYFAGAATKLQFFSVGRFRLLDSVHILGKYSLQITSRRLKSKDIFTARYN